MTRTMADELFDRSPLLTLMTASRVTVYSIIATVMATLVLALGLLSVFVGYFLPPESMMFLSSVLTLALVLTFLSAPLGRHRWTDPLDWRFAIDLALILAAIGARIYIGIDIDEFQSRWGLPSDWDVVVGTIVIVLVLEATRRVVSWVLTLVVAVFVLYPIVAAWLPGPLAGPPMDWRFMVSLEFMQSHGIFGLPLNVISSYVVLFIIFGSVLQRCGGGAFFINLALAATGAQTGGPAKASVIASALFGTISGSAVANVMVDGWLTIPLMRRVGYAPHYAAGVEAVASTGGQIMPPVMGVAAFLIAEFLAIPYSEVALAAA
ncbi:MAG: TRAP transporter large permease subunit, partial [Chloroflexi bacterium]|nr:TRAP transporter large permease subunit [Chloroflexota bacterium]